MHKEKFGFLFILSLGLAACEPQFQNKTDEQETGNIQSSSKSIYEYSRAGTNAKKLKDLAGQVIVPDTDISLHGSEPLPDYALPYIGRYHAKVPCDNDLVPCSEGSADFILNLLPDGTVHRSIILNGKVFIERKSAKFNISNYRTDLWTVNPEQTEIVVHRKEGIHFYYKIINADHLLMDSDKTQHGNHGKNKILFDQGYPKAKQSYDLFKMQE